MDRRQLTPIVAAIVGAIAFAISALWNIPVAPDAQAEIVSAIVSVASIAFAVVRAWSAKSPSPGGGEDA